MHVLQHAQLASVLSQAGPALLYLHAGPPPESVNAYWSASRTRLELWHQAMSRLNRCKASGDYYRMRCWWQEHLPLVEEVLVSEMLTRVVAAIADGIDRGNQKDDFSPIAQAIFLSHLEARNRVQTAILDRRGCRVGDAVRLNRLRRMTERWIDVLVGNLASRDQDLIRYGIDPCRASEHAEDKQSAPRGKVAQSIAWLAEAAMIDSLRPKMHTVAALPQANRQVADAVMLMLRPAAFDSVGSLKSLWLHRIEHGSHQTDQMIGEFLGSDVDDAEISNAIDLLHAAALAQWFR